MQEIGTAWWKVPQLGISDDSDLRTLDMEQLRVLLLLLGDGPHNFGAPKLSETPSTDEIFNNLAHIARNLHSLRKLQVAGMEWRVDGDGDEATAVRRLGVLLFAYRPHLWWCVPIDRMFKYSVRIHAVICDVGLVAFRVPSYLVGANPLPCQ